MKKEIVFKEGFGKLDVGSFSKRKEFLHSLKTVQEKAEVKFFDSMVECKLCDREEINFQYTLSKGKTYIWTGMYYHYVEEHRAIPSVAFQNFIEKAKKDLEEEIDDDDDGCNPTKQRTEGMFGKENFPIVGEFTGRKQFLKQLKHVEKHADENYIKGSYECVFCKEKIGSAYITYSSSTENWKWPAVYSHYIIEHNVIPSSDFIMFIAMSYKALKAEEGEATEEMFDLSRVKKILQCSIDDENISTLQAKNILTLFKDEYSLPKKKVK